ncbi:Pimeloyl-ACP methyl ester carboxylesterase [Sphingobium faniae]|nr:Pimeloyl-ACP methyl ester carboxylesterase [Sphingobium faniae]
MAIRKGYVDTTDGQIHYRYTEGGEGAPLVCFHMTASSSLAYEDLLNALDGSRPVYALDTPHYGQSFTPTAAPSMKYICQVLMEAIDNLGIDKFFCIGHHTGSNISAQLAADYPDRVLGIILVGVTYTTEEENKIYKAALAYDNPLDIHGGHVMTTWTRVAKDCEAATPYDLTRKWNPVPAQVFTNELIETLRAGADWHWGYQAVFSHDNIGALAQVKCPILLLVGTEDVVYHWHAHAKQDLPHAQVVEREGYGVYYLSYGGEDAAPFIRDFTSGAEAK